MWFTLFTQKKKVVEINNHVDHSSLETSHASLYMFYSSWAYDIDIVRIRKPLSAFFSLSLLHFLFLESPPRHTHKRAHIWSSYPHRNVIRWCYCTCVSLHLRSSFLFLWCGTAAPHRRRLSMCPWMTIRIYDKSMVWHQYQHGKTAHAPRQLL